MNEEATSALTFEQLITETAYKLGMASYGPNGDEEPQIPTDQHDLILCKRLVNKAIRMFIADGPKPNGWRWQKQIVQTDLWPQIAPDTTGAIFVTGQYESSKDRTLLVLSQPLGGTISFYPSMEFRQIWLNGQPNPGTPGWNQPVSSQVVVTASGTDLVVDAVDNTKVTSATRTFTSVDVGLFLKITAGTGWIQQSYAILSVSGGAAILDRSPAVVGTTGGTWIEQNIDVGVPFTVVHYISPTLLEVDGDATNVIGTSCSYAFSSTGDYTLPANFGGEYTGEITYVANTNRGMILHWTDEGSIRSRRQNYNVESGTPYEAAVRQMPRPSAEDILTVLPSRRRWELMTWRIASEYLHVIFPYIIAFDQLVELDDVPPAPIGHDEAIKAACLALCEKEVTDTYGPDWNYYRTVALANSYAVDARSAPKQLGYFGNPSSGASKYPGIRTFRDLLYQRPTVPFNS